MKNLSLAQVANGVMTRQALAKFESDQSDIRFSKLVQLLRKLHVSPEEFLYDAEYKSSRGRALSIYSKFYYEQDRPALRHFIDEELPQYQNLGPTEISFLQLTGEVLEAKLAQRPLPVSEAKRVERFLTSSDEWTSYEYELFMNLIDLFDLDYLLILAQSAFKHTDDLQRRGLFLQTKEVDLAFNLVSRLFDLEAFEYVPQFLTIAANQVKARDMFEHWQLKYQGTIYKMLTQPEHDATPAEACLKILGNLDMPALEAMYRQDLDERIMQCDAMERGK